MTADSELLRELYVQEKAAWSERSHRGARGHGRRPSSGIAALDDGAHESVGNVVHVASEPAKGSSSKGRGARTPEVTIPDDRPGAAAAPPNGSDEIMPLDAYWGSFGDPATRVALRSSGVSETVAEVVIGQDDRIQISATNAYPWRAIASLIISPSNGPTMIGTGWMVSPRLLLTAGHCVYLHDEGGWPNQIEVIPGRNGSDRPFGSCTATDFRSVQGWVRDRDSEYDYGAILLPEDCRFGDTVGWFGYQTRSDEALEGVRVNIAGYPGDKPSGTQWWHSNALTDVSERVLEYEIDTFGGQSGAPVWVFIQDRGRFGVGIHVNGALAGNSATRITAEVAANIGAWTSEVP
jgi:V8-like Glu-specific endopeptidase